MYVFKLLVHAASWMVWFIADWSDQSAFDYINTLTFHARNQS